MKPERFEVLSEHEVQEIHRASMHILQTVGVRVDFGMARQIFREAGADVNEETQIVRLTENLVMDGIRTAPGKFDLHGPDATFRMTVGEGETQFAGLGTPIRIIDTESGAIRPTTYQDMVNHIILIDHCKHIHNSQMDIWPNDIPMTTIHTEAIEAWARNSKKSFGLGCYGYLPTLDMMRMMSIVAGGKQELRKRPRFMAICSVLSPLQMTQVQLEGLLICAEYGQPIAMSPEAIAGATAPATLAGLVAQENAAILAHVLLAQLYRPGAPVLYGTVSTIANMRHGTVALGAVETGLITAASAQMARSYGLPVRSVGGTTESKAEDVQAGMERTQTLLAAVLAGVNLVTCAGTLDSSMLESDAMLLLDDDLCGSALRMARGIEVDEEHLALDLIKRIGPGGNYLAEEHTVRHYRKEHFIPALMVRDPYEAWVEKNGTTALENAKEKVRTILAAHQPIPLDTGMEQELLAYKATVAARSIEEFYSGEMDENQDWTTI